LKQNNWAWGVTTLNSWANESFLLIALILQTMGLILVIIWSMWLSQVISELNIIPRTFINLVTETPVLSTTVNCSFFLFLKADFIQCINSFQDINDCNDNSCYIGVKCHDFKAPLRGFQCGPCPMNHTGNGRDCIPLQGSFHTN